MDIAEVLNGLHLDCLSEEWTNAVWESEFMDVDQVPNVYDEEVLQDIDVLNVLDRIIDQIKRNVELVSNSRDSLDGADLFSWQSLVQEHSVLYRELLSVLMYFMKQVYNGSANGTQLCTNLKAASVYFLLLTIPGSNAYFIFHFHIYEQALQCFSLGNLLLESKKPKPPTVNVRDEASTSRRSKGSCDQPLEKLTENDKKKLLRGLHDLLLNFSIMLNKFPLTVEDALKKTVFYLVSLTRVDIATSNFSGRKLKLDCSISTLTYNAYMLISSLCTAFHGTVEETVKIIMMYLLPNVAMVGNYVKGLAFSSLSRISNLAVHFIVYLLVNLKEECYEAIFILIQHVCLMITDKADFRQKGSENVVSIMRALPSGPYTKTIKWLLTYSHAKKVSYRIFAVEVISKLLCEDERPAEAMEQTAPHPQDRENGERNVESECNDVITVPEEQRDAISHKYLLGILFSRCHDKCGLVRTKALSSLAGCAKSNNASLHNRMKEIFVTPYEDNDNIHNKNIVEKGFMDSVLFLKCLDNPSGQVIDPLPGGKAVVAELLDIRKDDKVFVRKSALQLLESIVILNRKWMTQEILEVLCDHCRDPAMLIKKQMIQALTDILCLYPDDDLLPTYYVNAVLPQICNSEIKVQEKVLEALQSVIVLGIVANDGHSSPRRNLPWILLKSVITTKKRKFFLKACSMWEKNNDLPKNLVRILRMQIGTENNTAAWLMLSCISEFVDIRDPGFVMYYFQQNYMNTSEEGIYTVNQALDVLASCWKSFSRENQNEISLELLDALRNMRLDVSLIGSAIDVATLITWGQVTSVKEGHAAIADWAEDMLKLCETYLVQNSPLNKDVHTVNMEHYVRTLVLMGDVAQLCPGRVKQRTAECILSILITSKQHYPELWNVPGLQAVAVVTLGKICLQHEYLAKRIVPVLGNLLTTNVGLAEKVNVMSTLSDMCIRYTAMVEPLVPKMCMCLGDPEPSVRYNTLVILIRLLQQDFLKLRGTLFFHLITMLGDEEKSVSELITYYLTDCLVMSHKNIMYHNIVESIFYFNKYEGHEIYSYQSQDARLFDLSGPAKKEERCKLYRFMCEHMSDEYRVKTIHKICVDILGGVVSNVISLNEVGVSVVRDAFFILSCDELHLQSLEKQPEDENASSDVSTAINTAKKSLISEFMKKQIVDFFVPAFIQFRLKLDSLGSRLLPDFRRYLRDLFKDYKDEVLEIFADCKSLAEEILAEIQKNEEEEEERRRRPSQNEPSPSQSEEDARIPLLVELATNHLRISLRPRVVVSPVKVHAAAAEGLVNAMRAEDDEPVPGTSAMPDEGGTALEKACTTGVYTPMGSSVRNPVSPKSPLGNNSLHSSMQPRVVLQPLEVNVAATQGRVNAMRAEDDEPVAGTSAMPDEGGTALEKTCTTGVYAPMGSSVRNPVSPKSPLGNNPLHSSMQPRVVLQPLEVNVAVTQGWMNAMRTEDNEPVAGTSATPTGTYTPVVSLVQNPTSYRYRVTESGSRSVRRSLIQTSADNSAQNSIATPLSTPHSTNHSHGKTHNSRQASSSDQKLITDSISDSHTSVSTPSVSVSGSISLSSGQTSANRAQTPFFNELLDISRATTSSSVVNLRVRNPRQISDATDGRHQSSGSTSKPPPSEERKRKKKGKK